MTRGQTTTTTLLAIIAVLLGLNMLVRGSPTAEAQMTSGPAERTVVAGAVAFPSSSSSEVAVVLRFWSDGAVDATRVYSQRLAGGCGGAVPNVCDGPTTLIPGSCMADVDRDSIVGVPDLLTMLAAWGACPSLP